ncbi:MAG: AAA family ATPase [Eubacteriaceae bacterium]|nr:AAA family ATPase [Eubacteriaceae bacterium]
MNSTELVKYHRTRHLEGSNLQLGDEDLSQVSFAQIAGKIAVAEEKCDGANCAVSFSGNGSLLLQSRGHYLEGGYREKHFNLLKQWAAIHKSALYKTLGSRFIMYGEWMYAKHTIFYDSLPHYFLEFDIYDRKTGKFLDTPSRHQMLEGLPIVSVPVLQRSVFGSITDLTSLVGHSNFIQEGHIGRLRDYCVKNREDAMARIGETDHTRTMEEKKYNQLISLVPDGNSAIEWDRILNSGMSPYFLGMSQTQQEAKWHGEGDVLAHTKMVCENLVRLPEWERLGRNGQQMLFIAALLHDAGKIYSTRLDAGQLVAPNHSIIGERLSRVLLWKTFGMAGNTNYRDFRETVCALVRHHSKPVHFYTDDDACRKTVSFASIGGLANGYTNELLYILGKADLLGRVSSDTAVQLDALEYFKELSIEAGCFTSPLNFPDPYSRYAYLSGRKILPGQKLHNDTWGTAILMSGISGTGKDTYISKHFPDLPVVSLDSIRREMGFSPVGPQGKTVRAARERAKEYLRSKQPFVWNATSIKPSLRRSQVDLFIQYKAFVKIVFLETTWEETIRRNKKRKEMVPEKAISKMLDELVLPQYYEAHEIEWIAL